MTKIIFMLTILMSLNLVSCGKSGGGSGSSHEESASSVGESDHTESDDAVTGTIGTNQNETTPTTIQATSSLPALALSFKTNVTLMNLSAAQATKYNKAVAIVKKVVATEAFRTKVLNYKYAGKTQFADNKGRTNAQIYQTILDAAESLKPVKNNTMDLGVKMYYQNSSVVGYTNGSISYINVNTKFFNTYAANQVAGNLTHEWLHKLGYTHDSASTAKRPYSVPYAVGYIMRDLGKSFL
jgi:hypothetical protein